MVIGQSFVRWRGLEFFHLREENWIALQFHFTSCRWMMTLVALQMVKMNSVISDHCGCWNTVHFSETRILRPSRPPTLVSILHSRLGGLTDFQTVSPQYCSLLDWPYWAVIRNIQAIDYFHPSSSSLAFNIESQSLHYWHWQWNFFHSLIQFTFLNPQPKSARSIQ